MSAWGWPPPSAGPWPRAGTPGQEGAGRLGVQAGPPPSLHLLVRGPVGTHPPHGRPAALCQTPQATQVPLEAAQFESRGLGPSARALRGLCGCRRLLPPPQASSCHQEQVTQEQLHGLGWGSRAGVTGGSSCGRGRVGARGARGRLRAALPRHCTRVTHVQCNSNAPRGRPPLQAPTPATCHRSGLQRGLCQTPHPPAVGPEGGSHSPLDPSLSQKARRAGPAGRYWGANPTVFCRTRGDIQGWKGGDRPPQTCQAPSTTPHLVNGAASWCGGQALLQVATGLLTHGQAGRARLCLPAAQHGPGSLEGVQSRPGQGSPVGARAED